MHLYKYKLYILYVFSKCLLALSIAANKFVIKWKKDIMWHFCGNRWLMSVYWNDYSSILTTLIYVLTICVSFCCASRWTSFALKCSTSITSLIIVCCTNTCFTCCIYYSIASAEHTARKINVYNTLLWTILTKILISMHLYICILYILYES